MMRRMGVICGLVSVLTLALAVNGTSRDVPYPSEIRPLHELTQGVKTVSFAATAAEAEIANIIKRAEEQLAIDPSSTGHREMLRLYAGTGAGLPRLILGEEGPLCWSVPLVRDGVIVGFFLFHPYTGSLMASPLWGGGGSPVMSIDEEEWNGLEARVARALGVAVGTEARLIQLVNGTGFTLYLAVLSRDGVRRIDVTSLGEPGGLAPRLLHQQPVPVLPASCVETEPQTRPDDAVLEGELDLPIPTSFSVAVLPRIVDQDGYGACTGHASMSTREWWECGAVCYDGTGNSNDYTCECDKNWLGTCECIGINLSREYMYDRSRTWPEGIAFDSDCGVYGFCIGQGCGQGTCTNTIVTDGDMMSNNPSCHSCAGASIGNAAQVLVSDGVCTEECQPYPQYGYAGPQHAGCTNGGREACTGQCPDVSGPCGDDFTLQSCDTLYTMASIIDAIFHHGPVLGGALVCSPCWSWSGCQCYPTCTCQISGGHAFMLYGYDNDLNPPVFYFQNSWGTSWGQSGRGIHSQAAYEQLTYTGQNFYFTGGKDVRITLDPLSTVVARGDTLVLTATVENFTDQTQTFYGWTDAILPNGNPFPGNPVAGPQSVTLPAYGQASRVLRHVIPQGAPLGFYTYVGSVGVYPLEIFDDDSFFFIVMN
jgi:hypothetical protein